MSKLWEKISPDSIKDSIKGGELWGKEIFIQKIGTYIKAPAIRSKSSNLAEREQESYGKVKRTL